MTKPMAVTGSKPANLPATDAAPPNTVVFAAAEVATLDASIIDCESDTLFVPLKNPTII